MIDYEKMWTVFKQNLLKEIGDQKEMIDETNTMPVDVLLISVLAAMESIEGKYKKLAEVKE